MMGLATTTESPAVLLKLNACRLYLGVTCLSDLCLANGRQLDAHFLYDNSPIPSPLYRNSFLWPRQPRPPYTFWKLWNQHLRMAFCTMGTTLTKHLGDYSYDITPTSPQWDWFADGCGDNPCLWKYSKSESRWCKYHAPQLHNSRRQVYYLVHGTWPCEALPPTLTPVSVRERDDDGWIIVSRVAAPLKVHHDAPCPTPTVPPTIQNDLHVTGDDFCKILNTCCEGQWFVQQLLVPDDITQIFVDFLHGRLMTGSDGSFNPAPKFGTACWRIENFDGDIRIFGYCIIPGRPEINSSFRCELGGILGNTICLWVLAKMALNMGFQKDELWRILVSCDGYAALERSLLSSPDRLTTSYKHYDLVSAIMGYWREMPCAHFPVYVKSHQDKVVPPSKLTRLEQLNISVDITAKLYMRRCVSSGASIPSGRYQFGVPTVTYASSEVSTELYHTLMHHCTEDSIKSYWIKNWSIPLSEKDHIAWEGFERGMSMLRKSQQVFITKWLSRQINIGPTSQRYDADASKLCLRCRKESETLIHCVRCKSIRPKVNRRLQHLFEQLLEFGTCPILVEGIKRCTEHWLRASQRPPIVFLETLQCEETLEVLDELYSFGWWRFMQGIHLYCFRDLQQSYFESSDSSKSLTFWHGRVIHALWSFLCDLHEDRSTFLVQRRMDLEPINPVVRAARRAACLELSTGRGTLPPFYHQSFRITPSHLTKKKVSELRDWLRTVRCARENDILHVQQSDDFSPNGKYRAWLMRR